ncbi:hypothetical protein [Nitrospirillum sp. BR 11163]|uniref:hypothetical protein n=1 Tax=Nitrospirillum sp. BR 11163 TaxID=3104323 RepID=UPI002AFF0EDB|nr:hypothetical protein [Nitrospirillum sp. BR 11163]MEA1674100.1 hypothetical protein [Nitrospirillum sp. BR 11163]
MLPVASRTPYTFDPMAEKVINLDKALTRAQTEGKMPETRLEEMRKALDDARAAMADTPLMLDDGTPNPARPTYRLRVPNLPQRAAWARDLRSAGLVYPMDADLFAAVLADLRALEPDSLDELVELVDRVKAGGKFDLPDDDEDAPEWRRVLSIVNRMGGEYAAAMGARSHYLTVAPYYTVQAMLVGWSRPELFARRNDQCTPATMEVLTDDEVAIIGWKALSLINLGPDAEKNSASPSTSASDPAASQTASKK